MLKPNSPVTANLIKARELIVDPKDWSEPPGALTNCIISAMNKVFGGSIEKTAEANALLMAAGRTKDCDEIWRLVEVNRRGHKAALNCFDRAIELSLQEAN